MEDVKLRNFHQAHWNEPIIFELSVPGRRGLIPPAPDEEIKKEAGDAKNLVPKGMFREQPPALPELDQKRVLAHYIHLAQETLGANLCNDISQGTCTMKYNPRINEELAAHPGIASLHPWQDVDTVQGILQMYYEFEEILKEISGMDKFSLHPQGGAHAVYTAASIMRAYHRDRGELDKRREIISAAFTHPCDHAAPATAGFRLIILPPSENGYPSIEAVKAAVSERTAGMFITNPEDTGIYNTEIDQFVKIVHDAGGLCFYDQANANVLLGIARAREAGFDMCHFNIHKTFGTPHGCSGPGLGALGVRDYLAKYLPFPTVEYDGEKYYLDFDRPESVGKIRQFQGPAGVLVRAYAWIRAIGQEYLKEVSEISTINHNYLQKKLQELIPEIDVPYAPGRRRLEEARYCWQKLFEATGVSTTDIMRRVGDFGLQHYWTSHHPWVVPEPMTLEPCESYGKEDLDEYAAVLKHIRDEAYSDPEVVKNAPHKCASHKLADESALDDPKRWATTWRAYVKKRGRT
ncbi:MAG TPA: aminomethyl-transferring glycine dehydrogenase subunit GcvPB [Acetomicrobium flavidum]|uniref:aminomethyl-transferring glycine dehydrogenase subunit GcvPB n=2 Tax=Acetomicrobium flavidum TaxID=49896 RepID=UPI002C4CF991|nr:aminomethyl-transferring glycine dehydrogenase subunit GcvPB [Acetomicrobium flavidum]HOP87633.1 aminomethyl-transferring glycine dehydrogenase subunit GcvPB [Acetomicrobium flavidum]